MSKRPLTKLPDSEAHSSVPTKRHKSISTNISALSTEVAADSVETTVIKINTQGVFLVVAISQPSKSSKRQQKAVEWLLLLDSNNKYSCMETTASFVHEHKMAVGQPFEIKHFAPRVNKSDINVPFYRTSSETVVTPFQASATDTWIHTAKGVNHLRMALPSIASNADVHEGRIISFYGGLTDAKLLTTKKGKSATVFTVFDLADDTAVDQMFPDGDDTNRPIRNVFIWSSAMPNKMPYCIGVVGFRTTKPKNERTLGDCAYQDGMQSIIFHDFDLQHVSAQDQLFLKGHPRVVEQSDQFDLEEIKDQVLGNRGLSIHVDLADCRLIKWYSEVYVDRCTECGCITERDDTTSKFKCTNSRFKHVKATSNVVYGVPSSNGKFASPLPIQFECHEQEFDVLVPDAVAERIFGKSAKLYVQQVSDTQTTQGTAAVVKFLNKVKLPTYRLTINVSVPGWMDTPRAEFTLSHVTSSLPVPVPVASASPSRSHPPTASSLAQTSSVLSANESESFLDGEAEEDKRTEEEIDRDTELADVEFE